MDSNFQSLSDAFLLEVSAFENFKSLCLGQAY